MKASGWISSAPSRARGGDGEAAHTKQDELVYILRGHPTWRPHAGRRGELPDEELEAIQIDGKYRFVHKDGRLTRREADEIITYVVRNSD